MQECKTMLEPIDGANLAHALDLLVRGFPRRPLRFWEQAVERIARYNRGSGQSSIGQFLVVRGKRVGVVLTLSGQSQQAGGERYGVANLSSWYIDPEYRRLAPLMLRNLVRDENTVFTDLTPSARVIPMLPPLGFRPLNAGIAAIALPVAALTRIGDARVSNLEDLEERVLTPDTRARLERNAEFGATAVVLSVGNKHCPLLFVSQTLRQLPAAQLIYCEDNSVLRKQIGAVARFLLKQGKLVLIVDIPLDYQAPGVHFLGRGLKFAKGGCFDNRTDYAGSELLVVGQ